MGVNYRPGCAVYGNTVKHTPSLIVFMSGYQESEVHTFVINLNCLVLSLDLSLLPIIGTRHLFSLRCCEPSQSQRPTTEATSGNSLIVKDPFSNTGVVCPIGFLNSEWASHFKGNTCYHCPCLQQQVNRFVFWACPLWFEHLFAQNISRFTFHIQGQFFKKQKHKTSVGQGFQYGSSGFLARTVDRKLFIMAVGWLRDEAGKIVFGCETSDDMLKCK